MSINPFNCIKWAYRGVAQHDIAIFKLKTPLILNKNVAPVKLPEAGKIHTGASVLSGWGSISKKILPITPTVLQTVEIPIVDNGECLTAFDKIPGKAEIFDTQMCTGPIGSSVSACSVSFCTVKGFFAI